jgi:hypothetical protein
VSSLPHLQALLSRSREPRQASISQLPSGLVFGFWVNYRRSDKQFIADHFRIRSGLPDIVLPDWNYNVAPSTFQPVNRNEKETGERELVLMRWGLIPFFAKNLEAFKGFSTINARAEQITSSATAASSPPTAFLSGRSWMPRRNNPSPSACATASPLPSLVYGTHGKTMTAAVCRATAS